mgnify:CR=1 FL=1
MKLTRSPFLPLSWFNHPLPPSVPLSPAENFTFSGLGLIGLACSRIKIARDSSSEPLNRSSVSREFSEIEKEKKRRKKKKSKRRRKHLKTKTVENRGKRGLSKARSKQINFEWRLWLEKILVQSIAVEEANETKRQCEARRIRKERHNNRLDGTRTDSAWHYPASCSNRVRQDSSPSGAPRYVRVRSIHSTRRGGAYCARLSKQARKHSPRRIPLNGRLIHRPARSRGERERERRHRGMK